jgi:hypothetical protein
LNHVLPTPGQKRPPSTRTQRATPAGSFWGSVSSSNRSCRVDHVPNSDIVNVGNFIAACGACITLTLGLRAPLLACFAGAVGVFVVLTLLLNRRTFWISALTGGLVMTVAPALLLGSVGATLLGTQGLWVGRTLGVAAGLLVAFATYRAVFRAVRSER